MKYKIALDLDDVLARFYPAMCDRFNQKCLRTNIWDGEGDARFVAQNFHIIENNFRFWLGLDMLSRPNDINFEFDCYLTSSPKLMRTYRKDWLNMNGFPRKSVVFSSDKPVDMRRMGIDVLIDDNPTTLEAVTAQGMIPIQFVPPYMSDEREHLNPIRHLSQVPEILSQL